MKLRARPKSRAFVFYVLSFRPPAGSYYKSIGPGIDSIKKKIIGLTSFFLLSDAEYGTLMPGSRAATAASGAAPGSSTAGSSAAGSGTAGTS
jgi:hypothetical protein